MSARRSKVSRRQRFGSKEHKHGQATRLPRRAMLVRLQDDEPYDSAEAQALLDRTVLDAERGTPRVVGARLEPLESAHGGS